MKKRVISVICAGILLLTAGLCAVHFIRPGLLTSVERRIRTELSSLRRQEPIVTDEEFPYSRGEGLCLIVSSRFPLEEEEEPEDLVGLYAHKERVFELSRSDILLRQAAFDAAQEMFTAAREDGVEGFILTSGYRSREKQEEIYHEAADGTANAPGESEHELGLAFDVTCRTDESSFDGTEQFRWLSEHAREYGFILRYPEGKESLTGIPYESWHYRYVGREAAEAIAENGWCLEEYNASQAEKE